LPQVLDLLRQLPGSRTKHIGDRKAIVFKHHMFLDTHTLPYLEGCAPDISIIPEGYGVAAAVALALLELQVGDLNTAHQGKMEHYLTTLMDTNPDRQFAKGLVFNGGEFIMYRAIRRDGDVLLEQSLVLSLITGGTRATENWATLYNFILSDGSDMEDQFGWKPPDLYGWAENPSSLLRLKSFIACSGNVRVWGLENNQVCKHYTGGLRLSSYERELNALLTIKSQNPTDQSKLLWPEYISHNEKQHVLVTRPWVKPLVMMTARVLRQLVAGLIFLHKAGLVYRDLEEKHVGQDDSGNTRVFDLSTCVERQAPLTPAHYAGTIINSSEDVLEALASGEDAPPFVQQDMVAMVKTVYVLTHTSRLPAIRDLACRVADMAKDKERAPEAVTEVRKFWQEEFSYDSAAGREWRALVDLAHVDTPHLAAAAWGGAVGAEKEAKDYDMTVQQLLNRLEMLVCPR